MMNDEWEERRRKKEIKRNPLTPFEKWGIGKKEKNYKLRISYTPLFQGGFLFPHNNL